MDFSPPKSSWSALSRQQTVLPSRGCSSKSHPGKYVLPLSPATTRWHIAVKGSLRNAFFENSYHANWNNRFSFAPLKVRPAGDQTTQPDCPPWPFCHRKGPRCARGLQASLGAPCTGSPATFRLSPQKPLQTWKALFLIISELLCPVFFMPNSSHQEFLLLCSQHCSKSQIPSRLGVFSLLFQHLPGLEKKTCQDGSTYTQLNKNRSPTALPVHTQNTCPKAFTPYTKVKRRQNKFLRLWMLQGRNYPVPLTCI